MKMNMIKQFSETAVAGLKRLIPVRRGLFVGLSVGLALLYFSAASNHPLAVDFYATMMFESADRIIRLFTLYLGVRVLTGNKVRTHRLWKKVEKDVSNPLLIAWCISWVIAVALVISSVN